MARLADPILAAIEDDLAAVSVIDEAVRIRVLISRDPDELRELALIRQAAANIKRRALQRLAQRRGQSV